MTGLLIGTAADAALGDPRRGHPVAMFGRAAAGLEHCSYADSRLRGALHVAACLAVPVGAATLVDRSAGRLRVGLVATATWAVLGGRSLAAEATAVQRLLDQGDLPAARQRLTHLVGRNTSQLDEPEISRAVIESVAENTCDAVVAPLLWGSVLGVPGLVGYRVINTLDAMIGHRSSRYTNFGWAAARLDDVVNFIPSRATAGLTSLAAPLIGGSMRATMLTARRWGRAHPSPNSGMSEAAFAGALGIRLGGRNIYRDRVEDRPVLGDGRAPGREDIRTANRLLRAVTVGAATAAAGIAVTFGGRG
jgi:adenosylcobinamide-phosphate synthase